jgi:ribonuclease P protein component
LAAEKAKTRTHARFPYPEREPGRPQRADTSPPQRPRATFHVKMTNTRRLSSADFRKMRPVRRAQGDFFSLAIAPRTAGPAWACVVSKKVSKKAVTRNLVKRRCRSVLAKELKNFREPLALILSAKKAAAEASFSDIRDEIRRLIDRIS